MKIQQFVKLFLFEPQDDETKRHMEKEFFRIFGVEATFVMAEGVVKINVKLPPEELTMFLLKHS